MDLRNEKDIFLETTQQSRSHAIELSSCLDEISVNSIFQQKKELFQINHLLLYINVWQNV